MKNSAVLKSLSSPDIDTYMAMSKEELINGLKDCRYHSIQM